MKIESFFKNNVLKDTIINVRNLIKVSQQFLPSLILLKSSTVDKVTKSVQAEN